jgi:hypothetical protein
VRCGELGVRSSIVEDVVVGTSKKQITAAVHLRHAGLWMCSLRVRHLGWVGLVTDARLTCPEQKAFAPRAALRHVGSTS